jgi:hypothetical protein
VQRGRKGRRLFIPEDERRRSKRIAVLAKGTPASYVKKAQKVLMSRLGICDIQGEDPVDCLEKYAEFFREPLPPARVEALAKLFFLDSAAALAEPMV